MYSRLCAAANEGLNLLPALIANSLYSLTETLICKDEG